jgi:hypothetical protein
VSAGGRSPDQAVGLARNEEEIALFNEAGMAVHYLKSAIGGLPEVGAIVQAASGADLLNLMLPGRLNP